MDISDEDEFYRQIATTPPAPQRKQPTIYRWTLPTWSWNRNRFWPNDKSSSYEESDEGGIEKYLPKIRKIFGFGFSSVSDESASNEGHHQKHGSHHKSKSHENHGGRGSKNRHGKHSHAMESWESSSEDSWESDSMGSGESESRESWESSSAESWLSEESSSEERITSGWCERWCWKWASHLKNFYNIFRSSSLPEGTQLTVDIFYILLFFL